MNVKARSKDGISRPSWPISDRCFSPWGLRSGLRWCCGQGPAAAALSCHAAWGRAGRRAPGGTWLHSVSWPPASDLMGQPEDHFFLRQGFCPRPGPSLGLEEPRLHHIVFLPTQWAVWWEAVGSADGSWCPRVAKVPGTQDPASPSAWWTQEQPLPGVGTGCAGPMSRWPAGQCSAPSWPQACERTGESVASTTRRPRWGGSTRGAVSCSLSPCSRGLPGAEWWVQGP